MCYNASSLAKLEPNEGSPHMPTSRSSIKQGYTDLPVGQIHYRTAGDGPPLLLLHLTLFSSDQFLEVVHILATKYRVIAMDRFGHGTSDPPPQGLIVEDLSSTVVDFLNALGVERTSILGQHTGATEAVEVALSHPQRVEKLVLAPCADFSEEYRAQWLTQAPTSGGEQGGDEYRARWLMDAQCREPKMDGSHLIYWWQQRRQNASPATTPEVLHRAVIAALQHMEYVPTIGLAMFRHHISERLPLVQAPTLFMAGEHDVMRGHIERHRALLPPTTPAEIAIMEDAGDFAALEKPEEFARIVMDFLAGA